MFEPIFLKQKNKRRLTKKVLFNRQNKVWQIVQSSLLRANLNLVKTYISELKLQIPMTHKRFCILEVVQLNFEIKTRTTCNLLLVFPTSF